MATQEKQYDIPEAYFDFEEQAEYKSEYHQGQIRAMAGTSWKHNQILVNVSSKLVELLADKPCQIAISDIKLAIESENRYTYPDIMIICGQPQFIEGRNDTIVNPEVIIEILSESTEKIDRGDKFRAYWTLDSLKEYVLIDQYRLRVEYFRQLDEKTWELRVLTRPDDQLTLQSLEISLPLNVIYRNCFPESPS